MWYMYILECNDRSYYVGSSENVEDRVKRHNNGRGSRYTKARKPVKLVYTEEFDSSVKAKRREVEEKLKLRIIASRTKGNLLNMGQAEGFPRHRSIKKSGSGLRSFGAREPFCAHQFLFLKFLFREQKLLSRGAVGKS
ncbi:MAG: GIY-YIG nuclease family protein [Candidatus Omnitrophica bacterium]|nr:GIY-YIG nuclease family protein [Candidatus Omnitrophota bacterium]